MAVEFVGGGASGSAASAVCPIPAVEPGDLIILHSARISSESALATPSGYTQLAQAGSASSVVYYKFANISEPAGSSPTNVNAQRHVCVVYRGVNLATPFGFQAYFEKGVRSSLNLPAVAESTPPAAEYIFLLPVYDSASLLSTADMSGFTLRASDVSGQAYSTPGPTFPGRTLTLSRGTSTITASFIELIAAGGATERQRSRLILTPW